jgi:hypothetical protein
LQIKALLGMPTKKAKLKGYMNQRLAIAMALIARQAASSTRFALQQKFCA